MGGIPDLHFNLVTGGVELSTTMVPANLKWIQMRLLILILISFKYMNNNNGWDVIHDDSWINRSFPLNIQVLLKTYPM